MDVYQNQHDSQAGQRPVVAGQAGQRPLGPQASPRPPRRSRQDDHLVAVYQFLHQNFWHCTTPEGADLLVDKNCCIAYPLEAEVVIGRLKRAALEEAGLNISRGTAQSAITIMRDELAYPMPIGYGRAVLTSDGDLCVLTADGVLVIPVGQTGYNSPQYAPKVAFLYPANGLPVPFRAVYGAANPDSLPPLLNMLNVPEDSVLLVIAWMLTVLLPDAKNYALELVGEPQSGKSTLQEALKRLLDPSRDLLTRNIPNSSKQVLQLAQGDHLVSLDDVENLKPEIQRELKTVMQGTLIDIPGLRRQYKTKIHAARPLVMNGLESVATERDLAESTLVIELPTLKRQEQGYLAHLEKQAKLDGAYSSMIVLLAYVAHNWKSYQPRCSLPPGLEDFCRIGCLAAEGLGKTADDFMLQLRDSLQRRYELELAESPVAAALLSYHKTSEEDCVEVTAGQLLSDLEVHRPKRADTSVWPNTPRKLGALLRKNIQLLKAHGLEVTALGRHSGNNRWRISTYRPLVHRLAVSEDVLRVANSIRDQAAKK